MPTADLQDIKQDPELWAALQFLLGINLRGNPQGEHAENIEQTIHYYQQVLEVYTYIEFPADHRRTQQGLGNLYFGRQDWTLAETVYSAAIQAGSDLLAAAYTETGRRAEISEVARLYVDCAYCLIRLGRPAEGLLRLEQG